MQMTEQHHINLLRRNTKFMQTDEQLMMSLDHTVALSQVRRKKCTHASFHQNHPAVVFNEKRATRKLNATHIIGWTPALPQCPRHIAKHGSPVEALPVPQH